MINKELLKEVLDIEGQVLEIAVIGNLLRWADTSNYESPRKINIHHLAFLTRDYLKTKLVHLSLNQSVEDIFKEANNIHKSLKENNDK